MDFKVAVLGAAEWAAGTDEWLLSSMGSQMDCIMSILGCSVATVGAQVYLGG